jgi:phenylalanyl-tRNA synthetase beta chain
MFSGYAAVPFQVEPVEVIDAFGASAIYPDLAPCLFEVPVAYINARTGLDLDAPACAALLARMQLAVAPIDNGAALRVEVPASRSDVLHACDVMEDVAIAYGFNNLPVSLPPACGAGRELPLAQLCEALRAEVAAAGFTEVLTWALCSRAECFASPRLEDDPAGAVAVGNPATAEFEIVRTSLLPGALKTLGANKDAPLPARLFEIGDVVLPAPGAGVGARNSTRLVALHCDTTSSFEVVHGLLNRVMAALGVPLAPGVAGGPGAGGPDEARWAGRYGGAYEWRAEDAPAYFPGRHAAVYARGSRVGSLGVVHPEVLAAFDVAFPVVALELDLEPFVFDQAYAPLPTRLEV